MNSKFSEELKHHGNDPVVGAELYSNMVGSLLFLANHTRHDISLSLGILSQISSKPTGFLLKAIHRAFGYLRGTIDFAIVYEKGTNLNTVFYCDSDFAGDTESRKSRTGWVALINGDPVSWASVK